MLLLAARASLLLAIAFAVTLLLRRASAASRHAVWLAAFGAVLLLPIGTALLPSLRLRVLPWLYQEWNPAAIAAARPVTIEYVQQSKDGAPVFVPRKLATVPVAVGKASPRYLEIDDATLTPAVVASAGPARWPWSTRLLLVWLTGAVMVAAAFTLDVLRTHLLACAAVPEGDLLVEEAEVIAASLGIARDVRLVTWDGPAMPMTWGALRPVVLLPASARGWDAGRRREVLLHELAHVRRGDWAARLLAALVCALHWFNPLAWMAARRLRDEQELACDDAVLAGGASASAYASSLLEVARSLRSPSRGLSAATVAMARPSQLTGRLLAILDESRCREPLAAGRPGRIAAMLTLLIAIPLAAAVPARRELALSRAIDAEVASKVHGAIAAGVKGGVSRGVAVGAGNGFSASRAAVAVSVGAKGRCDEASRRRGSSSNHSSSSDNDDGHSPRVVTITITRDDCAIMLRMIGNVRFADDESDVVAVPAGASFRITEDNGDDETRFDATSSGGQVQRRFRVNGADVAETAELRAWLASALQIALVESGFDAVPRMLRAYRAGGLDSALKLSSATESDYGKRTMLMALIDSVHVPPADAIRIARQAETIGSDYEKAELLIAVATKLRLDGPVQEAMIDASAHIGSDYERARVLTTALSRPDLSPEAAGNLIRSAAGIGSDYEKAELLIKYLKQRPIPDNMRRTFFDAANSIGSDYEHRRLLAELLNRQDTPLAVVGEVCEQAGHIGSDYERAELLVQVANKFGSSADARALVRRAAQGIGSDYEKNRVLATLGNYQ